MDQDIIDRLFAEQVEQASEALEAMINAQEEIIEAADEMMTPRMCIE